MSTNLSMRTDRGADISGDHMNDSAAMDQESPNDHKENFRTARSRRGAAPTPSRTAPRRPCARGLRNRRSRPRARSARQTAQRRRAFTMGDSGAPAHRAVGHSRVLARASHQSPDWPSGYWPQTAAPPDAKAWDKSARAFRRDLKAMCDLVSNPATDLYARIPHGSGQTILREALLTADHNAYHLGQLVLVRRLLGAWKS